MEEDKSIGVEILSQKPPIGEILNTNTLPEMAFQSYDALKNNSKDLKEDFVSDKYRNPKLAYKELDSPDSFDQKINRLISTVHFCQEYKDELGENGVSAIESTLDFRANEYQLVKLFGTLNEAVDKDAPIEYVEEIVRETRELNERLYGAPNPEIANSAFGHIWQKIDSKHLSDSAVKIRDELENGFHWGDSFIPGMPKPNVYKELPSFDSPALAWAGEIILSETAPIEAVIQNIWDRKVAEFGEDYAATPVDIKEMYEAGILLMDPENTSDVNVVLQPESFLVSWDSTTTSIRIGEQLVSMESAEKVYKSFLHEGYIHGGRAINGSRTGLPIMGTGLFTDGERVDYLTFEEGYATSLEEAVSNTAPSWGGNTLRHYINISLARQGYDFRSVYETAWRYLLLDDVDDGQEISEEQVAKNKTKAYNACVRIFRGAPTELSEKYPGITPVTYNKDLSYLNGRVIAMDHINEIYSNRDEDRLIRLTAAKFDPTIPEQNVLVDQFSKNLDFRLSKQPPTTSSNQS